jgi:predicted DNA-binding protein
MSKKSDTPYQIRLPENLLTKAGAAADRTGLSKNDVIKLAILKGLDLVVAALTLTPEQLANIPAERDPLKDAA